MMFAKQEHVSRVRVGVVVAGAEPTATLVVTVIGVLLTMGGGGRLVTGLLGGISAGHAREVDVRIDNAEQEAGRCQHDHDNDAGRQQ